MENYLEICHVTKRYQKNVVVNDVSFALKKGQILGILGPNGAGKSTLLALFATVLKPDGGDIKMEGTDLKAYVRKNKYAIGFVPQDIALYEMFSVEDNLKFWAAAHGVKSKERAEKVTSVLKLVDLLSEKSKKVEHLSGGMKRRVNIAAAIMHEPKLLILDEPTVGVDIWSRKAILNAVLYLKGQGSTVIFTSHLVDDMESICDYVALMDQGRIQDFGEVDMLLKKYGQQNLEEVLLNMQKGS
jgi:ABC-2 type transport system ATP-binding protein